MKPQYVFLLLLVFTAGGCISAKKMVQRDYAQVDKTDGVSSKEAIAVAQNEFLQSEFINRFAWRKAAVLDDRLVNAYPDYWFVSFYPKDIDDSFSRYLVVIRKEDGQIIFSKVYRPLRVMNYDWVFEADR